MDINGQTAIVTGGGSGMGAATARSLAAAGANVAVLDLNPDAAAAVATEIGGTGVACDVANEKAVEAAIVEAREVRRFPNELRSCHSRTSERDPWSFPRTRTCPVIPAKPVPAKAGSGNGVAEQISLRGSTHHANTCD